VKQAILVINLESRTDRRFQMMEQLRTINWAAEFFPAVRPLDKGGFPSIGARGCFLSHLNTLKLAKDRNLDRLILIEDDLNFDLNFSKAWTNVEQFLNSQDYELFYPAHTSKLSGLAGIAQLPSDHGIQCSHFLIFSRKGIDKAIENLEAMFSRPGGHPLGGPMHVDGAYSTIRRHNLDFRTYAHFPSLGYQRPSRTDVGESRWFDHFPVLQPIIVRARNLKMLMKR
jgi:hypothetical protein